VIAESGVPPGELHANTWDVSNSAEAGKLFATAVETFGRVDLLFNNAGLIHPFDTIDEELVDGRGSCP
jgi:NAD(P)-dependent dehydrogenase (short-subunit alcohol dehydrogenase family)